MDERGDVATVKRNVSRPDAPVIYEAQLTRWLFDSVNLVARVADNVGYRGAWAMGLLVVRMKGAQAFSLTEDFRSLQTPEFDEDLYLETLVVGGFQLAAETTGSVRSLIQPLLRALGTARRAPMSEALSVADPS